MKHSKVALRTLYALVIAIVLINSLIPPLALMASNSIAPRQQGGSNIYLPLVAAPVPPLIPETTNILTATTTQLLTSISNDGTFTFRQMTPELTKVTPGEVIVGGVSAAEPNGFLRSVTAISRVGEQIILQTTAATLADAVEQGEVHVSGTLSPTNVQSTILASGVTLSQLRAFFLEIKDIVLFDADGNQQTTQDQVRANGSIDLDSDYTFDLLVQHGQLERLHFTQTLKRTTKLTLASKLDVSLIKQKVEIARYTLAPITVFVGILPIVFTPVLSVQVGMDGSIYVGVSAGITEQTTLTAGVDYQNRTWAPVSVYTSDLQYNPPTLSSGLSMKGYASVQLSVLVYGVVGPYTEIKAYLKLQADPATTPWWKFFAGLEVPVGVKLEILSPVLAAYQTTLIDYQKMLAEAKDAIAFASESNAETGLYVINSDIGTSRKLAPLKHTNGLAIQCPTWSPNGEQIGFFRITASAEAGDIYIVNNDGTNLRNSTNKPFTYDNPTWSPTGATFAYGTFFAPFQLVKIDSSDSWQIKASGEDQHPDWSPDGKHLVFDSFDTSSDIFVINVDGTGLRQLTNDPAEDSDPAWSPDDSRIAFVSNRSGDNEIFVMKTDGSNIQQLTSNPAFDRAPTWSPDGTQIAFVTDRDNNNEIYIMNSDGSNQHNITHSSANEYCPDWIAP